MAQNRPPTQYCKWFGLNWKRLLLISALSISTSALISGQKTVTLKNGQSFLVNTHVNGMPMYSNNEYIEIKAIHPAFEKIDGWRSKILIWSIYIKIHQDFKGKIEIGTPLNLNTKQIVSFDAKRSPSPGRTSVYFLKVLDSEHAPEVWNWLKEKGESWIPFTFKMQIDSTSTAIEFINWAVITEKDKKAAQTDIQLLDEHEKVTETTEISFQDGKTYNLKLNNGNPIRFSNTIFQIDSLTPGLVQKNSTDNDYMPVWIIKGRYRGSSGLIVTISSLWNDTSSVKQLRVNGQGEFTIQYAPRASNPEFWDWLDTKENKWIPVQIKLEFGDSIYNSEFIEWFYINSEIHAFFKK